MGGKKSNHIQKILRSFKAVRTWQLVLILIPLLFVIATLLRFDHLRMVELRSAVIAADQSGDETELEHSMQELQQFVFTHIIVNVYESNGVQSIIFGTGPFYLEQQYRRAADAAIDEAAKILADDSNPNGNIYAAVAAICQPLAIANGWVWSDQGYLDCWTSELAKYPTSDALDPNLISANIPSTELYRREFSSPIWAPSVAGFAILVAIVIIIFIVARLLIWIILKLALIVLKRF